MSGLCHIRNENRHPEWSHFMSAHNTERVSHTEKKGVPMKKTPKNLYMWVLLLALPLWFMGARVTFAQAPPAAGSSVVATQAAAPADITQLAGVEACAHCHKTSVEEIARTAHADTSQSRAAADLSGVGVATNCDTCHGSSKAHADAELAAEKNDSKDPAAKRLIFDFGAKTTTPEMINKQCLTCHASGSESPERLEFLPPVERRQLRQLPLAAPRGCAGKTAGQGPARTLLYLPRPAEIAVQHALPASR